MSMFDKHITRKSTQFILQNFERYLKNTNDVPIFI